MTEPRFLLDTNVVSELARPRPDARVSTFVAGAPRFAVSVMLFHELRYGCEILSDLAQQARLTRFVAEVHGRFGPEALPVTSDVAETAARLRAHAKQRGRVLTVADALIGATAVNHGLTLATRNERDFVDLGVRVLNPFEAV